MKKMNRVYMLFAAFLCIFNIPFLSSASTFVGNGGNAGDVELAVAQRQIRAVFKLISSEKDDADIKLCTCADLQERHSMCDILDKLSKDQREYCTQFMKEKSSEIIQLVSTGNKVVYKWTDESISVMDNANIQAADAVTEPKSRIITINKPRFLEMKTSERMFLLTHELFHLLEYESKPIVDMEVRGPFTQKDGGRQLLNAAAASGVVEALGRETFFQYQKTLNRSRHYKDFWVSLVGLGYSTFQNEAFYTSGNRGSAIEFRYQADKLGYFISTEVLRGNSNLLSTIRIEEKISRFGVGASYKMLFNDDPMNYWSQSYLLLKAKFEGLRADYQIRDDSIDAKESTSAYGLGIGLEYYFPVQNGFWVFLGLGYATTQYEFKKMDVNYNRGQSYTSLGVSYGF